MFELVRGLIPRGFDVHVALQSPGPLNALLDAEGIPWTPIRTHRWIGSPRGQLRIMRNRLLNAQTAARIAELAIEKKAVLVHTNTLSSPVGAMIARKADLPHVWHMREAVDTEPGSAFIEGLDHARQFINETTDRVICISDALAEETALYADRSKIRRLHNGPLPAEPVTFEPREPIDPKGEIRLLLVGAICARKGQDEAIRALAILRKRGFNGRLIVGGDGNSAVVSGLQRLAKEQGVGEAVEWLGYVDPKPLFRSSDISLVCGPRDPLPRVAIESLAHGIPTVAIRSGGIPEIVDHEVTGWLYDRSPMSLAKTVETVIRCAPEKREAMGVEGNRRSYRRFNVNRYCDDMVALYREMGIVP